MGSRLADGNLNSEIQDEFDDCMDDKVCVYETVISRGYIKQEPYDMEDKQENIHNYVHIKDENIDDPTAVVQETGSVTNTRENYLIRCQECGEEYDLYCLKCPMLIRIFDSNNPQLRDNRVRRTLPKNFIDICEISSGVGIVALRAIPKGTVFGPFEGLDAIKDDAVSKWKLKNKELVYSKDPRRLNWMQYIRRADQSCHRNLTPFQYEAGLYYHSDSHINVGDELLVWWDSEQNGVEDTKNNYWQPQVCERLDDTYACTLCCVGYKSISHLTAHNSRCVEKRNQTDFCKEVIQCVFCAIYLDKKEYSDYHMDRCCERHTEKYAGVPRSPEDTDKPELKDTYKCSMCEYSAPQKWVFKRHQLTHTDLWMYECLQCPYRTVTKARLQDHVRKHGNSNRSRFKCEHCGERFARYDFFALHQKKKHSESVQKDEKCVSLTTDEDVKPYRCDMCDKRFNVKDSMNRHVRIFHNGKKNYKCPKCDFETIHRGSIKAHLLNLHSGVQRFECPKCTFKTCYKFVLKRHLRYHTDAKRIKCKSCDMEFWNRQLLISHQKEVHQQPAKLACTLCSYKTTKSTCMKRHFNIHSGDKPFKCDTCAQRFTRKSSLKKHAQNIHRIFYEQEKSKSLDCLLTTNNTSVNI